MSETGFPHTSGDGPSIVTTSISCVLFSPHKWGWSEQRTNNRKTKTVFPTQVGMVRSPTRESCFGHRFPHTSGDGPSPYPLPMRSGRFSPHKWGWSVDMLHHPCGIGVFPTQVGMVRHEKHHYRAAGSFPHTSGDGPANNGQKSKPPSFSPHKWGWSVTVIDEPLAITVFPTQVGMVRMPAASGIMRRSFPHTSGDGPDTHHRHAPLGKFSPHKWGWSVNTRAQAVRPLVFPTRVGMVRIPSFFMA